MTPPPVRILLVEDNPGDVRLVSEMLRAEVGIAVEAVDRLDLALSRLRADQPDLILLDLGLPDSQGAATLRQVTAAAPSCPVIVLTGNNANETGDASVRDGAQDFLVKGQVDERELRRAIHFALERHRLLRQHLQAMEALEDSQREMSVILESTPVPTVIVDGARRVVRANRAMHRLAGIGEQDSFGLLPGNLLGCVNALGSPEGCGKGPECALCPLRALLLDALADGQPRRDAEVELRLGPGAAGAVSCFLASVEQLDSQAGRLAIVSLQDITARRETERHIARLNRLLDTIREINRLIVRETNQGWLLAETCRIAVEQGQLAMAWISLADRHGGDARPVAMAGRDRGYFEALRSAAQAPADGPAASAFLTGETVIVDELRAWPGEEPWAREAEARGFRSRISVPLSIRGRRAGALSIFAADPGAFDPEVVSLLEEMAADLGFALASIETGQERDTSASALLESEERYRGLFQHAPIGIYRSTPDGRILDANPALLRMLGYDSVEELATRNLETEGYVSPDERTRFKEAVARQGEVASFAAVWLRRDGTRLHVREHSRAILGDAGGLLCYEGTAEDVTEQHLAEEALRRSESHLSNALKIARLGHWEYDVARDEFTFNDEFYTMLRTTAEREGGYIMSSRAYASRFPHPDDAALVQEETRKALETSDPAYSRHLEQRVTFGDGSAGHIAVRFSVVKDRDGKTVKTIGVNQDITEQKRAEEALRASEEQLRQAQKMEAVGRLAGGVAHDFNNLLQALLSYATLIRSASDNPERVKQLTDEIVQNVNRGASLTRQLLIFSRRSTTNPEILELGAATRVAAGFLRHLVRENITLHVESSPDPIAVYVDPGQLDQVLMNLAVNASDAMPDGGSLTIRARAAGPEWAEIEVEDSGHGIPPEIRELIFDPFFTTKERGKGTGLGLSVVHGIVTKHGGTIEVESRAGAGTTFRIRLPRSAAGGGAAAPAEPVSPELLPEGHGERVLVVEDEDAARAGLRETLALLGYDVTVASCGDDARRLPAEPPFALLLTDLLLPDVAGNDLAAELAGRWPGISVVLMSGYTDDEVLRRGIGEGAVRFLQKPFDIRTLAKEIRGALGSVP